MVMSHPGVRLDTKYIFAYAFNFENEKFVDHAFSCWLVEIESCKSVLDKVFLKSLLDEIVT